MSEKKLHKAVCEYLKLQYPHVMFNTDLSGATKLTIGQAVQIKALRSNKGWPDIFIAEPRNGLNGLWLELKAEGSKLFKKNGEFVNDHIASQNECLLKLIERGYAAYFAIGFDNAKILIDEYLTGRSKRDFIK